MNEKEKILERQLLENGMELIIYDRSRLLAGDRWLVEILCEAHVPCKEDYWDSVPDKDREKITAVRSLLGEKLVFSSSEKRTFVDAEDKDTVCEEMVKRVYDSMLNYLNRPDFPLRLFQKQYQEARGKMMIREAMNRAQRTAEED